MHSLHAVSHEPLIEFFTEEIRESKYPLWRIKEVVLNLGILCNTVEGTAHALASLDRSFAAIFTQNSSSLTFPFRIWFYRRLFTEITKIVPNPLQLLEEGEVDFRARGGHGLRV